MNTDNNSNSSVTPDQGIGSTFVDHVNPGSYQAGPVVDTTITDLDLTTQNMGSTNVPIEPNTDSITNNPNEPNVDPNVEPTKDTSDSDNKDSKDPNEEEDYENYTPSALFAKAFKDEGFDLFSDEELKPDLQATDVISKIIDYKNNIEQEAIQIAVQQVSQYQQYVDLMVKTGGQGVEKLNPLFNIEKYASINLDDPNVTTDILEDMVRTMYSYKNVPQDAVEALVKLHKTNNELGIVAKSSSQFFNEYKETTFNNIYNDYIKDQQEADARDKQIRAEFATSLKNTPEIFGVPLEEPQRAELYDYFFSKDKLVIIPSEDGKQVQEYVSGYELDLYNTVNNPQKMVKLLYLLKNDFNTGIIEKKVSTKVNKSIIDAIDKGKGVNINKPANTYAANQHNQQIANNSVEVLGQTPIPISTF